MVKINYIHCSHFILRFYYHGRQPSWSGMIYLWQVYNDCFQSLYSPLCAQECVPKRLFPLFSQGPNSLIGLPEAEAWNAEVGDYEKHSVRSNEVLEQIMESPSLEFVRTQLGKTITNLIKHCQSPTLKQPCCLVQIYLLLYHNHIFYIQQIRSLRLP